MSDKPKYGFFVFPETANALICRTGYDGGGLVDFPMRACYGPKSGGMISKHYVTTDDGKSVIAEVYDASAVDCLTGMYVPASPQSASTALSESAADTVSFNFASYMTAVFSMSLEMRKLICDIALNPNVPEKYQNKAQSIIDSIADRATK